VPSKNETDEPWLQQWIQSSPTGRSLHFIAIPEIAPEDWEALLEGAGAPRPWRTTTAPSRIAAAITFRCVPAGKRPRNLYDRACEAIDELGRVLPQIVAEAELRLAALDNPPSEIQARAIVMARSALRHELRGWKRLGAALPEFQWERSPTRERKRSETRAWHSDAARLYGLYLRLVEPEAGISEDGPAVRFVALALKRLGHPHPPNRGAVAQALKRMRQNLTEAKRRYKPAMMRKS
jgi:hypothetical protein